MKRDYELIFAILLFAEETCDGNGGIEITTADLPEMFHNVDEVVLLEHVQDTMAQGVARDWCV
jgi:hypothetical protein